MTEAQKIEDVDVNQLVQDNDAGGRNPGPLVKKLLLCVAVAWSLFQLWIASPLPFSLGILVFSILLWIVVARQIKRLITQPINQLEELSRQVTREESYALRAQRGNDDEIGSLAEAFNTMLERIEAREQQLKRARDDAQQAFDQAQSLAEETRHSNRKLELEVQVRSKIEQKLTGFQKYLNSIIDSMPSALIALDEQLYVTQWNQEASSLSGTRLDEALNQPIFHAFATSAPKPRFFMYSRAASAEFPRMSCMWKNSAASACIESSRRRRSARAWRSWIMVVVAGESGQIVARNIAPGCWPMPPEHGPMASRS